MNQMVMFEEIKPRERKPRVKAVQETMFAGNEFEVAAKRVEKATSLDNLPMFDEDTNER